MRRESISSSSHCRGPEARHVGDGDADLEDDEYAELNSLMGFL